MVQHNARADEQKTVLNCAHSAVRTSFARFGIVGAVVAAINFVIYSFMTLLGISYVVASITGSVIGVSLAFMLQSRHVFRNQDPNWKSLARHLIVYTLQIFFSLGLLSLLIIGFGVDVIAAYFCAVPVVTLLTFLAQRKWTFQN